MMPNSQNDYGKVIEGLETGCHAQASIRIRHIHWRQATCSDGYGSRNTTTKQHTDAYQEMPMMLSGLPRSTSPRGITREHKASSSSTISSTTAQHANTWQPIAKSNSPSSTKPLLFLGTRIRHIFWLRPAKLGGNCSILAAIYEMVHTSMARPVADLTG